jgi:carbonic anhydrase
MPAIAHWLRYADAARLINEARAHETAHERLETMVREDTSSRN